VIVGSASQTFLAFSVSLASPQCRFEAYLYKDSESQSL